MSSENSLLPFYIMSLPWNDRFSYKTALYSINKINENPTITRKQLDELIDFRRTGDVDVYEFLEIPRIGRTPNGYRAGFNLCSINAKTEYLVLTDIAKETLKIDSFDKQIKVLFLIVALYYPHIRALLDIMFSNQIYFKTSRKNSFPSELKRYYILPDEITLEQLLLNKWNSNNHEFLKQILLNPPIFNLIKNDLKTIDRKKIIITSIENIVFSEENFKNNRFNERTKKACINLIGLRNSQVRSVLYDFKDVGKNVYSIKLKEDLVYTKFLDFSMRDLISSDLTPSKLEAIDKCIIDNYSLDVFYTLQELMYDLEDFGFNESEILDWKLNIEKNQKSNNTFESILLKIETKSGVMGAFGLINTTQHAKLKFLRKED